MTHAFQITDVHLVKLALGVKISLDTIIKTESILMLSSRNDT